MKRIAFILLFFAYAGNYTAFAQTDYSYFYFEGDQQTPFYVKVEGKMQPRYGSNHFIIPDLAPGYTHFEILFQQNEYPAQKYFLEVPKNAHRSFVLRKIKDKFALYDLQQRRYIMPGNDKEEGAALAVQTNFQQQMQEPEARALPPITNPKKQHKHLKQSKHSDRLALLAPDTTINLPVNNNDTGVQEKSTSNTSFINGIVLNEETENQPGEFNKNLPPIPNTDCPNAMSNEAFEGFALKLLDRDGDDSRLKYLKKEANSNCFSTEQVRIIAQNLKMQSSRYEAVKILYRHTSDQESYGKLESLFNTPFLKKKFEQIIQPN